MRIALALACLACTGCISARVVPPPAAPAGIVPSHLRSVAGPRGKDQGTLVLDVPRGALSGPDHAASRARVEIVQVVAGEEVLTPVCETPCSVNVPTGKWTLRFTSLADEHLTSTADVEVKPWRTLVRHQLGYEQKLGPASGFGGLLLGGVGLVGTLVGTATIAGNGARTANSDKTALGAALLSIGVVVFATGWLILHLGRGERQPGATTIVTLPAR